MNKKVKPQKKKIEMVFNRVFFDDSSSMCDKYVRSEFLFSKKNLCRKELGQEGIFSFLFVILESSRSIFKAPFVESSRAWIKVHSGLPLGKICL